MLHSQQIEELLTLVSSLDRDSIIDKFHCYHGRFPIDFTPEYLGRLPLEKLRHIFVAMCLQNQRLPDIAA